MIINFYNANGKVEHIYEEQPHRNNDILTYDVVIDKNDPRYKLQQLKQKEEWEKFKLKGNINNKQTTSPDNQNEEELPYNPNIIVIPEDPPEVKTYTRKQIVKVEEDIPRQEYVNVEYERNESITNEETLRKLTTNVNNEEDVNDIMVKYEMKLKHPHKDMRRGNVNVIRHSIMDGMGWLFPKEKCMYSKEFFKYGNGFCDYFKLMKFNMMFYFGIFIFGIIFLSLCISDYKKYHKNSNDIRYGHSSFQDSLFKLTYAYYYNSYFMCNILPYNSLISNTFTYNLTCNNKNYFIHSHSLSSFSFLSNPSTSDPQLQSCHNYTTNSFVHLPYDISSSLYSNIKCNSNNTQCILTISNMNSVKPRSLNPTHILIQYKCSSIYNKHLLHIYYAFNFIVIILTICLCYYFYFMIEYSRNVYMKYKYELNQYTVMIKDLEINTTLPKMYIDLQMLMKTIYSATMYEANGNEDEYVEDYFNNEPKYICSNPIYQLNYAIFEEEYLRLYNEKYKLISKFEIPNYINVKTNCFTSKLSVKKYNFDIYGVKCKDKTMRELCRINNELKEQEEDSDYYPIEHVFITFKTKAHADKFIKCYKSKNCLIRALLYFICKQHLIKDFYFKNKWLNVTAFPSSPQCIYYEHLRISKSKLNIRKSLIWLLIIILILINIILHFHIILSLQKLTSPSSKNPTYDTYINCNFTSFPIPSSSLIEEYEHTEHTYNKILNLCNCRYMHITKGDVYTKNYLLYSNKEKGFYLPCYEYISNINKVHNAYVIMFVIVNVLNLFVMNIMPLLSKVECYVDVNMERNATFVKCFVYGIFSYGICPMIVYGYVDYKYKDIVFFIPFFTGEYYNLNVVWFYNVGTMILLNIIIGMFIPYVIDIIKIIFILIIRKCCYNNLPKDNNKYKYSYWHTGPTFLIENKLGNYLSIIITIQLYNMYFTIPFTSLFICISSFIMMSIDKLTFIYINHTPFKYNQSLLHSYTTFLYWFTLLSLGFNIYFSIHIYYDLPSTLSIFNTIKFIISKPLFLLLLIILCLCIVIPYFIWSWLKCFMFCCCNKCKNETAFADDKEFETKVKNDLNIYEALPLKILYKNYTIRKLEFTKLCNYSMDVDLEEMMKYYREKIDTDRNAISAKLNFVTGKNCEVNTDFDRKIKLIMERYIDVEKADINENDYERDYSYNMAYHELYETAYLNWLINV